MIDAVKRLIPKSWMPPAPMQRIIMHWTAGDYIPDSGEETHYNAILGGDLQWRQGVSISLQHGIAARRAMAGVGYAAHTRGLNEKSIGLSMCCAAGAQEKPIGADWGRYPPTKAMYDEFIRGVNEYALAYNIPVTYDRVFSHAEAQALGYPQSGKWDFTRFPWTNVQGARAIGDMIRRDILALRNEEKPAFEAVREGLDTKKAEVAVPTTTGVAGYAASEQGDSMLNAAPDPSAAPGDWFSDLTGQVSTLAAYGFSWGGKLLMALTLGIALWTAFKYARFAWRYYFPPKPTEAERARGVD